STSKSSPSILWELSNQVGITNSITQNNLSNNDSSGDEDGDNSIDQFLSNVPILLSQSARPPLILL
ncbi:24209_t:CDS:2, partial [Gigaspora margarita]